MLWFKKRFEGSPVIQDTIQNRFETIFNANGAPPEMLLIEQPIITGVSVFWLRLPDTRFRSAFPELEEADPSALPKRAVLLVGHPSEFEKLFE